MVYKQSKLNSINSLTIEIEENFSDQFSILAYDEEGEIWIEKFEKTIESAKVVAEKLYKKLTKKTL
jgi:hypothetical protein